MANIDNSINYIELPLVHKTETKAFYSRVFGWVFTDWGEHYISFTGAAVEGGFNGESGVNPSSPGVLVVLYAKDLPGKLEAITQAGGKIKQAIYDFPGGRRFHFLDPNGNELAVWSEA